MIVLYLICLIIGAMWIASIGPFIGYIMDYGIDEVENIFDPVAKYNNGKLNMFGVVFVTIISTIAFLPIAIVFWFYKLCTVGRR